MTKMFLKMAAGTLLALSVSLTVPALIQPAYAYSGGQYLDIDGNVVKSGETVHVVLCQENISLRAYPSTEAPVLAQIPLYSSLVFKETERDGDFCLVTYLPGTSLERTGYVLTRYLDFYEPQVWNRTLRVYNCKKSITLRSAPSTSAAEICQIPLGASVEELYWQADSSFYLVNYRGFVGYALKNYLR